MPDATYQLYRAEPRRRRRWPYIVIAAVCVFAAVVGWQLYGVPRVSAVTPGPDAFVKTPSTTLVLDVKGLPKLRSVTVTLDGKDVTADAKRDGNTLTLTTGSLADGEHAVAFSAESSNLFRHNVREDWRFTVDTSIPTLKLDGAADEGRINTDPATFSGKTEPYATVTVVDGTIKASGTADASGRYAVSAKLPDGASDVAITTADRAGNATTKKLHVFVDALPPVLKVTQLDKTMKKAGISVRVKATDQLGVPTVKFVLDGETARAHRPGLEGQVQDGQSRPGQARHGRHRGRQGRQRRHQQADVHRRQHRALRQRHACGRARAARTSRNCSPSSSTPASTPARRPASTTATPRMAVRKLQAKYGLEVDGIVGGNVLNALSGQIVVDIGDLRLYLYRDGVLIKSYRVATGQPAYPTPTGTYSIVNMQKDPTWLPPDSDWAKEAKPIPPGTENPLGTRWMGTSAPGVGIHGVPPSEDSSIGTYASHGCIRMHNWDAVDLFERVVIGMPVIIRQ